MRAAWKIVGLSTLLFAIAFALARLLVPDVVPIGFADDPQPLWAVMTAFVLLALELIAAGAAILALAFLVGARQRGVTR